MSCVPFLTEVKFCHTRSNAITVKSVLIHLGQFAKCMQTLVYIIRYVCAYMYVYDTVDFCFNIFINHPGNTESILIKKKKINLHADPTG